jgi:hypothetical protein
MSELTTPTMTVTGGRIATSRPPAARRSPATTAERYGQAATARNRWVGAGLVRRRHVAVRALLQVTRRGRGELRLRLLLAARVRRARASARLR